MQENLKILEKFVVDLFASEFSFPEKWNELVDLAPDRIATPTAAMVVYEKGILQNKCDSMAKKINAKIEELFKEPDTNKNTGQNLKNLQTLKNNYAPYLKSKDIK